MLRGNQPFKQEPDRKIFRGLSETKGKKDRQKLIKGTVNLMALLLLLKMRDIRSKDSIHHLVYRKELGCFCNVSFLWNEINE